MFSLNHGCFGGKFDKIKDIYRGASLVDTVRKAWAHHAHFKIVTVDEMETYAASQTYDFRFVFGKFEPIDKREAQPKL